MAVFDFLKRWFGRPAAAVPPLAKASPRATEAPALAPVEPLPPWGDVSGDETLIYRRDSAGREGGAFRERQVAPTPMDTVICLAVLTGSKKGLRFAIPAQGAVIGRSATCELVLEDQHVSNRHAWVGFANGVAVVRDQGSTNGTFINTNGQNLIASTPLAIGDTIMLGGHYGVQLRVVADTAGGH
jgi:hypothetical protein